jgi:hypothetical protein
MGQTVFEKLSAINVNDKVEKKNGLTYLSWIYAWGEVKKAFPSATYQVKGDPTTQKPYFYDENLGYLVMTEVTIEGQTLEMWLPVMDGANKAMMTKPYTYKGNAWIGGQKKEVDKTVEAATMFDINKTLMRCLTKNLAMFGLGHYIYAGEDIPEIESAPAAPAQPEPKKELEFLKKGTTDWDNVKTYIEANKALGYEKIEAQVSRRFKLSPAIKKEIKTLIES